MTGSSRTELLAFYVDNQVAGWHLVVSCGSTLQLLQSWGLAPMPGVVWESCEIWGQLRGRPRSPQKPDM